ncbi:MAG: hypothetical protein K2M23_02035, partial [Alphaproteobacteria bacterium]|nr:hypothetical protein [Alphaproteobacteria bacterium]
KSACTPSSNQFKVGTGAEAVCCNRDIIYTIGAYSRICSNCQNAIKSSTSNSQYSMSLDYSAATEYKPITSWDITWTYSGQKYTASIKPSNIGNNQGTAYVCNDKILYKSYNDIKYTEMKGTKTK